MNFMDREVKRPDFSHKFNEMYKINENNFNEITDVNLIDANIYELISLQSTHKALMRDWREMKQKEEVVDSFIDKLRKFLNKIK